MFFLWQCAVCLIMLNYRKRLSNSQSECSAYARNEPHYQYTFYLSWFPEQDTNLHFSNKKTRVFLHFSNTICDDFIHFRNIQMTSLGDSPQFRKCAICDGAFSPKWTVPHQKLRHPSADAISAVGQSLPPPGPKPTVPFLLTDVSCLTGHGGIFY